MTLAPGIRLGPYEIVAPIGAGGMGVVYEAQDTRLGRRVAIKLLAPELADAPPAVERFHREARAASSLNHPGICTIHDAGESEGRHFIVMELIEGETLQVVLRAGPLEPERLVATAIDLADAVAAAHARGILHRDLKPANIVVTRQGRPKILDFGLAKLPRPELQSSETTAGRATGEGPSFLTQPGVALGTLSYMSPEQARGEEVDSRSDLFSLGLVLYEMATGRPAFRGSTTAVVFDALLNRAPAAIRQLNPDVPPEFVRIVEKLLDKVPFLRYQSADDVVVDLRRLKRDSGVTRVASTGEAGARGARMPGAVAGRRSASGIRWGVLGIAACVAVLVVLTVIWWRSTPAQALGDRDRVLVAEFENRTGEEMFDGVLEQALTVQLEQSPFLNVVAEGRVREGLTYMGRSPSERVTGALALELCQREGISAVIGGSIARLGTQYVLGLEATSCSTRESLALEQVEAGSREEVLPALGRAASELRRKLGESLASIDRFDVPIERATTDSLDALKAFSLGTERRMIGADVEAIPFYERAIALDPDFALAYRRLSTVYSNVGETEKAARFATRAFELRERVSEYERLGIAAWYYISVPGDRELAIEAFELWKAFYPRDLVPRTNLAVLYTGRGDFEKAVAEAEEARRLDPSRPNAYSALSRALLALGRVDEARRVAEEGIAQRPQNPTGHSSRYFAAFVQGDAATMADEAAWAAGTSGEAEMLLYEAQTAAFAGRLEDAGRSFSRSVALSQAQGFPEAAAETLLNQAEIEVLLGRPDRARSHVEAAIAVTRNRHSMPRAALVLTLAGAEQVADTLVAEAQDRYPEDTVNTGVWLPTIEALRRSRNGEHQAALTSLQRTIAYEHGVIAAFFPTYVRGLTLLAAGRPDDAAEQFGWIVEHRGVAPASVLYPLSLLGLARSHVAAGQRERGLSAYERLLKIWHAAEADLAPREEAMREYERLRS